MAKFKVGDIVRGTSNVHLFTNASMTKGSVEEIRGNGYINIKVIEHKENKRVVGLCYWAEEKYFELAEPRTQPIVIYRNGNEVIALDKNSGNKGTAKCNPSDKFDFRTGAKLAFERLMGEEKPKEADNPEFKPHLENRQGKHYGEIGTPTNYKDAVGRELYVGDVVEIFDDGEPTGKEFVVFSRISYRANCIKPFVMSIEKSCNDETGEITNGWRVVRVKRYTELEHGEKYGFVKAILHE